MIQFFKGTRQLAGWGLLCLLLSLSACDDFFQLETTPNGASEINDASLEPIFLPDTLSGPIFPPAQNSSDTTGRGGVEDPIVN